MAGSLLTRPFMTDSMPRRLSSSRAVLHDNLREEYENRYSSPPSWNHRWAFGGIWTLLKRYPSKVRSSTAAYTNQAILRRPTRTLLFPKSLYIIVRWFDSLFKSISWSMNQTLPTCLLGRTVWVGEWGTEPSLRSNLLQTKSFTCMVDKNMSKKSHLFRAIMKIDRRLRIFWCVLLHENGLWSLHIPLRRFKK